MAKRGIRVSIKNSTLETFSEIALIMDTPSVETLLVLADPLRGNVKNCHKVS